MPRIFSFLLLCWMIALQTAAADLALTEEHRRWLDRTPPLRVGITEFPPYLAAKNDLGEFEGLALDYLRVIEDKLQVRFRWVISPSYRDLLNQARDRQVDIIFAAADTPERARFLDFTSPYSFMENLVFTRKESSLGGDLEAYGAGRFAVVARSALAEYLKRENPGLTLHEVPHLATGFSLLAAGEVDGLGADAASGYAHAYLKGLNNIKLAGRIGFDYQLSLASRNDWPQLNAILEQALQSIPSLQREQINARWLTPEDPSKIDRKKVVELGYLLVVLVSTCMLLGFLWWNRRLKNEIERRRQMESKLEYLAYNDELTGFYNRNGFFHQLRSYFQMDKTDTQYLLLLAGVDHFRVKNELWGRHTGNEILLQLARRLVSRLSADTLLARPGGDKFACLLPLRGRSAQAVAEQLKILIEEPMILSNQSVHRLSVTIGMVEVDPRHYRTRRYLEQAEMAFKYGKRHGRGGFHLYQERMSQGVGEDEAFKEALQRAIEEGQLFLQYQPQLDVVRNRLLGFEALVRWQHPERGRIPPMEFIPRAERLGLITQLGDWVLEEACRQARQWRDEGLEFDHMAVNVSVQQFAEHGFVNRVKRVLQSTGLPPSQLELEVTESLFVSDFDNVRFTLQRLSDLGVRFSIDDFGTGFSSMLYLKQLPLGTIKLDREFVADIADNRESYQIVRASTQLAHNLGMEVIAEGIEEQKIQDILLDLGCHWAQGYFYSPPVSAAMIDRDFCEQLLGKLPASGCSGSQSRLGTPG